MTAELPRHGSAADQPRGYRRAGIPDCTRSSCRHPALYHGRALPKCDACDCPGYQAPARAR